MKNKQRYTTFGKHLTIDAYGCGQKPLENMKILYNILDDLPGKIGMRKFSPPYLIKCTVENKEDWDGFSGFVVIAESHISLHTFPQKRFFSMDVYSCKDFDHKAVIKYVKNYIKFKSVEINVIPRGTKFPQ